MTGKTPLAAARECSHGVGNIPLVLAGRARQLTGEPAAFSTHAGLASLLSVSTHLRFASLRPNFHVPRLSAGAPRQTGPWFARRFRHTQIRQLVAYFSPACRALLRGRRRAIFTHTRTSNRWAPHCYRATRARGVCSGRGGPGARWNRGGFFLTKSETAAEMSQKQAHFVWEKNRARTTYIVNRVPREVFWRL